MCRSCGDTGRIVQEVGNGVMFGPCSCEAAQRNLANFETMIAVQKKRLREAKLREGVCK